MKFDDKLPKMPTVTAEQRAEIEKEQAARRQKMLDLGQLSQSRLQYQREIAVIEELNKIPREDLSARQFARYTKALANVGDYAQAFDLTGEQFYSDVDKALKGKTKQCKCKPVESFELENGEVKIKTFPQTFAKQTVFDEMSQTFKDLMQCNACGQLFI